MLNKGLYKTYKYGGIGEAYWNACTKGSKEDGPVTASSDATTEGSTALLDPKYYSNVSTSQTQSTSSWGDCSAFAMKVHFNEQRKQYIAQNLDEILIEIARGEGEHLKTVTFYSMCKKSTYPSIAKGLKRSFSVTKGSFGPREITSGIDSLMIADSDIGSNCYQNIQ